MRLLFLLLVFVFCGLSASAQLTINEEVDVEKPNGKIPLH